MREVTQSGNDLGFDRQLFHRAAERNRCDRAGNAVEFEQDTAGLGARCPIFGGALTHADFGRLCRNWHVRENPDPQTTLTLDVTRDRAASRLDLARGQTIRLHCLQSIRTEVEIRTALCVAMNATLVSLAEFSALWLQHLFVLSEPDGRRKSVLPSSAVLAKVDRDPGFRP